MYSINKKSNFLERFTISVILTGVYNKRVVTIWLLLPYHYYIIYLLANSIDKKGLKESVIAMYFKKHYIYKTLHQLCCSFFLRFSLNVDFNEENIE